MNAHDILFALLAFGSEVLGTLSGFGSSTFFVPAAIRIEDFQLVLALTAILHCFSNFSKLFLFKFRFSQSRDLRVLIASVLFTGVGAALTSFVPVTYLRRGLGGLLIAVSIGFLFGKLNSKKYPEWATLSLVAFSGLATGLVGTGGAIRGVALTAMNLTPVNFVGLSAAIDLGNDLVRAIIYLGNGYMDWTHWFHIPMLAGAAFCGVYVGRIVLAYINQQQFEKLVAVFIFISGAALLV